MDLLRTFLNTAFSNYPIEEQSDNARMLLKKNVFTECVKKEHLELSDDHIRLIFKLYEDGWSKGVAEGNIFYALMPFINDVLVLNRKIPYVRLEHIFKWRELTQQLGEDLMVCAMLANEDLYQQRTRPFDWPSVLPTDDVNMRYFCQNGLAELHQHLKASTDVFEISWLCLMNHVRGRFPEFLTICNTRNECDALYVKYIEAVCIRLELFCYLTVKDHQLSLGAIEKDKKMALLGDLSRIEKELMRACKCKQHPYDYIYLTNKNLNPVDCVFSSERWFIYSVIKRVYEGDDNEQVVRLLWRYVVIKNHLRKKMVQNNENVGFGNFSEFERRKQVFLNRYAHYKNLLIELPIEEASRHHHVKYVETRVTPEPTKQKLANELAEMCKLIDRRLESFGDCDVDYQLIYHFIKKKDFRERDYLQPRNYQVRCEIRKQAIAIKSLLMGSSLAKRKVVAIDAANSEFFCRPEVFAQAYRYLKNTGLRYTYHVGEDFYDLTDGLRTIDEAIRFLHIRRGDRLGHCLALAMDAKQYYKEKHYTVPVPRQNLLDNLVWLYFKAKAYNIQVAPCVEMLILDKFSELSALYKESGLKFEMIDYYRSMLLRGDNPLGKEKKMYGYIMDYWDAYDFDNDKLINEYRTDSVINNLYQLYHFGKKIRENGGTVVEFKVDDAYVNLITQMQERMMCEIEDKGIAIECCPSSNYKIGRLQRYDGHPIFRMCDLDPNGSHHLPVTINTDDLGIFTTSLDNEYSLILSAVMKMKDGDGKPLYNSLVIQNWMERIVRNGHKYAFENYFE